MAETKSIPPASGDAATHPHIAKVLGYGEVIGTKARQLRALLYCTYGNACDSFHNMSTEIQDEYLWACADMADAIVQALEKLDDIAIAERAHKAAEVQHG